MAGAGTHFPPSAPCFMPWTWMMILTRSSGAVEVLV
eukprot:COSAG06_NODE_34277_length_477_cov_0.685185_3_plen_35_part_01